MNTHTYINIYNILIFIIYLEENILYIEKICL
jgi:hypothetical protein